MRRWKPVAGLILLTSFLLSACGLLTPLLTEKEVLSELSERYDGAEFVILETILSDIDKAIYGIVED